MKTLMEIRERIEKLFDNGKLDEQYAEYIMDNCGDRVVVCNGDTLIVAMESMEFAEEFIDYMVDKEVIAEEEEYYSTN